MEQALYGVLGMMCVILVITFALVRAPRRTHAWETGKGAPKKRPARALREARWQARAAGADAAEVETVRARNAEEASWVTRAEEQTERAARAATADDETLRDLEEYARVAEELTDEKDTQSVIDAGVKRRFLIVQLAAFSLLDPEEEGLSASLEARGFTRLARLHRAAVSMAGYLASDARRELVGVSAPPKPKIAVLSAPLSLDLFSRGGLVHPPEMAPNRALAQAEAELLHDVSNGAGSVVFVKAAGFRYAYKLRIEDGFRTVISAVTVSKV